MLLIWRKIFMSQYYKCDLFLPANTWKQLVFLIFIPNSWSWYLSDSREEEQLVSKTSSFV